MWYAIAAACFLFATAVTFKLIQEESCSYPKRTRTIVAIVRQNKRETVQLTGEYVDMYLDLVDLVEAEWKERQS